MKKQGYFSTLIYSLFENYNRYLGFYIKTIAMLLKP